MKIFVSWSGDRSKAVASAIKTYLPHILQGLEIFVSQQDIDAGAGWGEVLNNELAGSNFGILCLTPENLNSPWILFEAGAISKTVAGSLVVPYLFELNPTDVPWPIAQFQSVLATKEDTLKMVKSINSVRASKLADTQLQEAFDMWWPKLGTDLQAIPNAAPVSSPTNYINLLEEIVQYTRGQALKEARVIRLREMNEDKLRLMKATDIIAFLQDAIKRSHEGLSPAEMTQMKTKMILAAMILKEKNPFYSETADKIINGFPGITKPVLKSTERLNPNKTNTD